MIRFLFIAAFMGCAPSLSQLVDNHHYREAVCAAHDGSTTDRAHVAAAMTREANAHVHVDIVQPHHLERVLGENDPAINARFARVRLQIDAIPVDGVSAAIELRDDARQPASLPVTWSSLAAITGESLPPPLTDSTYLHRGTLGRLTLAFFTFGMSLPFTRFEKRRYSYEAPDSHYLAAAPRAHALRHAMFDRGCRTVPARSGAKSTGLACEWYVSVTAAATTTVTLDVTLAYSADRTRDEDPCTIATTSSIPLGRVDELALTVSRRFGSRMRPLLR